MTVDYHFLTTCLSYHIYPFGIKIKCKICYVKAGNFSGCPNCIVLGDIFMWLWAFYLHSACWL